MKRTVVPRSVTACATLLFWAPVGYLSINQGDAQEVKQDSETSFAVVSVKASGNTTVRMQAGGPAVVIPPGGFQYSNTRVTCNLPLSNIVQEAYSLKKWQIVAPTWLSSERYAVEAVMPAGTPKKTARLMLRQMLAERFGLRFHQEQRAVPVYALVQDKRGFKLQPVPDPGHWDQSMPPGRFTATAMPIRKFAEWLSAITDRPVVDMTGIKGVFNIDVHWTPDYMDRPADQRDRSAEVIRAVETQLGLKFDKRELPQKIMVIDRVEKVPTEN